MDKALTMLGLISVTTGPKTLGDILAGQGGDGSWGEGPVVQEIPFPGEVGRGRDENIASPLVPASKCFLFLDRVTVSLPWGERTGLAEIPLGEQPWPIGP